MKASLLFTRDEGSWQERRWEEAPAELQGASLRAELPSGARAYYLACEDGRGAFASSPYEELPDWES